MSLDSPYSISPGWKVDPDGRQDRKPGPVTEYKLTPEEIEKRYGHIKGQHVGSVISGPNSEKVKQIRTREREKKEMENNEIINELDKSTEIVEEVKDVKAEPVVRKLSKAEVIRLAREGMSLAEIAEYFAAGWNGKPQLLKAKIILYMSDKAIKTRGPGKKKAVAKAKNIEKKPVLSEDPQTEEVTNAQLPELVEEEVKPEIVDQLIKKLIDDINSPAHYTFGTIEVTDYIQDKLTPEEFEGFCKGVILQYVSRCRLKGGVDDLKKAAWYLNRIIKVKEAS